MSTTQKERAPAKKELKATELNEQLREAANEGNLTTVESLLIAGANIEAPDESGNTPLMLAAYSGHEKVVQYLLDKRASVYAVDELVEKNALMWAINNGHVDVVRCLVAWKEKNLDAVDVYKRTALICLIERFGDAPEINLDILGILLNAGANVEKPDKYGDSPLIRSIKGRNEKLVLLLLQAKANIFAKDAQGKMGIEVAEAQVKSSQPNAMNVLKLLQDWQNPAKRAALESMPITFEKLESKPEDSLMSDDFLMEESLVQKAFKAGRHLDKSLFIKVFLADHSEVRSILRPQGFGKTYQLQLLEAYFDKASRAPDALFAALKKESKGEVSSHQRKYPVIYLSFKAIKAKNFEEACQQLTELMLSIFQTSAGKYKIRDLDLLQLKKDLQSKVHLGRALSTLTAVVHKHCGEEVLLLVEDYDTAIETAYTYKYHKELIKFLNDFLAAAFKDNTHIWRGVLVGTTPFPVKGHALEHIRVYSAIEEEYAEHFGFTEDEVAQQLQKVLAPDSPLTETLMSDMSQFYGGWRFGDRDIYNTKSVMCFIEKYQQGDLVESVLKDQVVQKELLDYLLNQTNWSFRTTLSGLLQGHYYIAKVLDHSASIADLAENPEAIWSVLALSGYLSAQAKPEGCYHLAIPKNKEIRVFLDSWLKRNYNKESMAAIEAVYRQYGLAYSSNYVNKDKFIDRTVIKSSFHFQIYLAAPGFGKTYLLSRLLAYYDHSKTPVICLSLKNIQADTFEKFLQQLHQQMLALYSFVGEKYKITLAIDQDDLKGSLKRLVELMKSQLGLRVIIFVDDFDVPLLHALYGGSYQAVREFFRRFFGSVVQGKSNVLNVVFTGVFPFILDSSCDIHHYYTAREHRGYFGFTKDEVEQLLTTTFGEQPGLLEQVSLWYGGHKFNGDTVFQPKNILRFIEDNQLRADKGKFTFKSYAALDATLLNELLKKTTPEIRGKFKQLVLVGKIPKKLEYAALSIDTLFENPNILWNFLVANGYLNFDKNEISIPNKDLRTYFSDVVKKWFPLEKISLPEEKLSHPAARKTTASDTTSPAPPAPKPASPLAAYSMFAQPGVSGDISPVAAAETEADRMELD